MKEQRGILMFITSCMCGCGQMYQGYMKRGVSLLLGFFVIIAVAGFLMLGPLAFFTPVVWLYAFFDSYNLRRQIVQGTAPEDAYLFGLSDMDSRQMTALLQKRHSVVGWALVIVGLYLLYDMVMNRLGWFFGDWLYSLLRYDLPRMVVTVLVILLGLWFIRGPRAKAGPEDDIPPFTPPASGGAEMDWTAASEPPTDSPDETVTAAESPEQASAPEAEKEEPYGNP